MSKAKELLNLLEGLSAKQKKMIKRVVDGFVENFGGDFKKSIEALDALDGHMGNNAWGEAIKDEFYDDDDFRSELEKQIIKKLGLK
tara:strand:- start:1970 stop:2227 length:258 start_codon:yes stop_codon:yes gene_type:complete